VATPQGSGGGEIVTVSIPLPVRELNAGDESPPRPNAWDAARGRWEALQAEHHHLLRGGQPEALDEEAIRCLVATFLSPRHRPLLRELLLDLLVEDIADIADSAAREVTRG
jgi:hypothetical protein